MTARVRIVLGGAALIGPLAAFPALRQPQLAIGLTVAVIVVVMASRSVAYPLALWGLPGILIALIGTNPFPKSSIELFLVGWLVLAVLLTLVREENALPLRLLLAPPVLFTLGLAVLMLARLGSSPAQSYGSVKLQLFLAENVGFVIAGVLVARHRRDLSLWAGLLLGSVVAGSLVLFRGLLSGGLQEVAPGRFALYSQAGPIALARGSAAGLLLAVFLLLAAPAAWKRTAALAAIPMLAIAFIGAGSRGPVLGLAAGILILLALTLGDRVSRRRLLLLGAAVLVSAVLVPQLVPGQNVSRALSILVGTGQDAGGASVSNGRFQLWSDAWSTFANHPLGGIGTGGFDSTHPIEIYPHNVFLEAASELGIVGLALVAGLIGFACFHAFRAWRRSEGDDRRWAALTTAYLGAAIVNAQFSGDFANNAGIWIGSGLAFGLMQRTASTGEQEPLRRLRARWRRQGSGAPEPVEPRPSLPRPPARPRQPAPVRGAGGAIGSPAPGSILRGEVAVTCTPGGTGWTVGSVVVECSPDGAEWIEVGEASVEQDYEVLVLTPGGGRRPVAVLRSQQRAEQMRETLAAEHGVRPDQVEVRPARRGRWGGRDTRAATWDTRLVADGEHLLRAVTTDVTGRRAAGPEITVTVDNTPPDVRIDGPRHGAVLMGVVEVSANASDAGSGIALVRFELSAGDQGWTEVGTATGAPFRVGWNTGTLGEGDYELRAIALDHAGNEAVAKPVRVRVERVVTAVRLDDPGACLSRKVRLRASVGDESRIAGVEFQIAVAETFAWQALGAVAQPPFELEVDTGRLEDGVYDLRAVARDRKGGIDASRILRSRRIDNVAPSVSVSEPAAGALLRGEVPLSARAVDHGSGITPVVFQFTRDGATWRPVVTRGESAGAVSWDTRRVEDGEYLLRAVAGDAAGNLTTSDPVAVVVDNTPPAVSIEEPASGAYLGGTVRLRAFAADECSGVIAVRFEWSQDDNAWGELATTAAPPYGFSWDTTKVADGVYYVRPVARDRAGNSAVGERIELTVRNTLVFQEPAPEPRPPAAEPAPAATEAEPEAAPEPAESFEGATLWQLERLLEQRGGAVEQREELETLLYTLRPYARPDGTIPERFWPLLWESFGPLLEGR